MNKKDVEISKFDLQGNSIGEISVPVNLSSPVADPNKLIKDWIVFFRFNNRQWSASTKTRSEVAHSTKKIRQQKGSGRARAGGITAPQRVGGGRVGTPRPKFDQIKRLNKQQSKNAFAVALEDAFEKKSICIDSMSMEQPKTSVVFSFMKKVQAERRPLFVYGEKDQDANDKFLKSVANIKNARIISSKDLNVYDIVLCHKMIVTESAVEDVVNRTGVSEVSNG